jgi:hypothetical protein
VVEVLRAAELVDRLQVVLPLLGESIEEQVLVHETLDAAFGTGAVVPGDVEEERVLGPWEFLDGVHHSAHVVIDVSPVAGEHLHHAGVELLLIGVQRVPRGQSFRPFGELRV